MTNDLLLIAGPCAIESEAQIEAIITELKKLNISWIRAGVFKPRTSPNSFQGLGEEGLILFAKIAKKHKVKIITEILDTEHLPLFEQYVDMIQIGSRNMHNSTLLKKIAQSNSNKPILLKRGFAATKQEVLGAIEYLKEYGHKGEIILCERGIRTFADGEYSRTTLDINFLAALKSNTTFNHRIIIDPSHAAGKSNIVSSLALAGIAAGADGWIIETSVEP